MVNYVEFWNYGESEDSGCCKILITKISKVARKVARKVACKVASKVARLLA